MKTIEKICVRNVLEILSGQEMKLYIGGYDNGYGDGYGDGYGAGGCKPLSSFPPCCDDEQYDWWLLSCVKKPTSTPKIDACDGLKENDRCVWLINGVSQYGYCKAFFPGYVLHCSDCAFC